jgi:CheY-specific phosphatase CheX
MLVPKLRALPNLASARLIGLVDKGGALPDAQRRLFDAVLATSRVPEVFLADLEHAVTGTRAPLSQLLLTRPTLIRDVVSATELVFGMMLSCEVESVTPEGSHARWIEPGVFASIGLATNGDAPLKLLFRADETSAREIAARMIGVPASEVQAADVLASAAEVSNIILGRLRNRLVDAGLQATIQIPRTWAGEPGDESARAQADPHSIDVAFRAPSIGVSFEFLLFTPAAASAPA